jgi:coatomer protein complex subunit gamma
LFTNAAKYNIVLKFEGRDFDPDSGVVDENSYPDEFVPECVDLFIGDYLVPSYCPTFAEEWGELPCECVETFQIPEIQNAIEVKELVETQMGLAIVRSDEKPPKGRIEASGKLDGDYVLSKIQYVTSANGITMQVIVKGKSDTACARVANFME